jgi:hypothetical protein
VLAKRLKIEVKSDKRLGLDLGLKDLIFPGVTRKICKTQYLDLIITGFAGAFLQNRHLIFFLRPGCTGATGGGGGGPGGAARRR